MLDFPNNPNVGDVYNGPAGEAWTWDGVKWVASGGGSGGSGGPFLPLTGGTVSGPTTFASRLSATGLQTTVIGLNPGDIWSNGGVLCVV